MIELARPAFLWAGILLAGIPALLHLLRPVERTRKPLPTSRFLTPDPKRRVRFQRRPDELLLLLLRMLLCLVLGAGFAGMRWVGVEAGVGTLVVVDGGMGMEGVWIGLRERAISGEGSNVTDVVVVRPTAGAPELVRLGSGAPDAEAWAALEPRAGEVRLAQLLRALHEAAARATGVDSLRARVVTRPSWSAWGPGLRELRDSLWPGAIELVAPPADPTLPNGAAEESGTAVLRTGEALRAPVARALGRFGLAVDTISAEPGAAGEGTALVLRVGPADALAPLWRTGPDTPPAEPDADAFLLLDGRVVPGSGGAPAGTPAEGAVVPLLSIGGRPAAAARTSDGRCELAIPLEPDAPVVASGDLAVVLEAALREGCPLLPEPAGAEEAFRDFLTDGARPATMAIGAVRSEEAGLPLARWLLGFAFLLGILETALGHRIELARRRASHA